MISNAYLLLLVLCIVILCVPGEGVYAFGAGNIPSFAFLEGKAFRHGDIEDTLGDVAKKAGGFALGALIGKGGSKFGGLDIKRVYFGNWLRDYSQAVDVAGLQKLQIQTIINLCMVLGFMAHGYATGEFEVTEERLGVYLPTEHIDNPKGYPDNARQYHPKLRPPVDPRELEIDPRTGMKNYIANENGSWDTSKALVRRTLDRCIQLGRQARATGNKADTYEAYRLLGQALHTLEDFPAHSNFCELALVSMGYQDVFVHVGDQVRIQASNGKWVAPLVTGTFGSSDFIHSLLGEATDHISQASVSDLNSELEKARAKSGGTRDGSSSTLRSLLISIPGGNDGEMQRQMDSIDRIRAGPNQPGGKRPEDMSPQELHSVLWQVLTFRDSVVKKIDNTIEKIPGLGPLIEKLMDSISVFVFTTLEPFLKPLMKQATSGLQLASGEVINNQDQYEVFNDPRASDPTHSFLSKDHFNLILNEPAGNLGKIILIYTANLVVKAWDDTSMNVHQVTEDILQCLFHPDFYNHNSQIQREMLDYMRRWVSELGHQQHEVLRRLTKQAVRNHENTRLGSKPSSSNPAQGSYAHNAGVQTQHQLQGYVSQIPGIAQTQSAFGSAQNMFGQAQAFMGKFNGGQSSFGVGREAGMPPPPSTGEAASFYGTGGGGGPQTSSYAPPSVPPPQSSLYAPPSGPPPQSSPYAPPQPSPYAPPSSPPQHAGYNPSYTSPLSPPGPPGGGGGMSFPQADIIGGGFPQPGGYPPYGGPPPPGPPGGFGFPTPDAPPPHGGPHHGHGHRPPQGPFGW